MTQVNTDLPRGWYLLHVLDEGHAAFRINDVLKELDEDFAAAIAKSAVATPVSTRVVPDAPPVETPIPLPPTGQSLDAPPAFCVRRTCGGPLFEKDPTKPDVRICGTCGYHNIWVNTIQKWQPIRL